GPWRGTAIPNKAAPRAEKPIASSSRPESAASTTSRRVVSCARQPSQLRPRGEPTLQALPQFFRRERAFLHSDRQRAADTPPCPQCLQDAKLVVIQATVINRSVHAVHCDENPLRLQARDNEFPPCARLERRVARRFVLFLIRRRLDSQIVNRIPQI